ncbi:MAG: hypothetical protein GF409_02960 [Candidatus Omnitrophica bacterium]|nr:hypothetical protein [Candidatus Omnitrophota bacterium]
MMKRFRDKKGFTVIEVLFVTALSVMVIGAILSAWIFTSRAWMSEAQQTGMRMNMMQALETMKHDVRLSSLTYMVFYPSGASPYTAVSMPAAETDNNGFYSLNANGNIDWDKTIIYHLYSEGGGTATLRRTVLYNRDNTLTDEERYTQLAGVVTTGAGTGSYSTDTGFLPNVNTFEISSVSPVVDFYDASATPVRAGKVVFGWAKLDSGDHTIRFEVTGKNDLSGGYDIGIDNIMIEPAGASREFEYYDSSYAPMGSITVAAGSANLVTDGAWSNNNYLELSAGGVGSYVEIQDYYDLLRESAFDNASLDNTETTGDRVRIALDIPQEDEEGDITWYAYAEAGDSQQEGRNGAMPGGVTPPVAIRTVVFRDSIDEKADLIRVKFKSGSSDALNIHSAYITKRDGSFGSDGQANRNTSGLDVEEFHRHQQLFFKDDTGSPVPDVSIPADSEVWSVWTAYPLRTDSDYFISMNIQDAGSTTTKYWEGTSGVTRTYYLPGSSYSTMAGVPDWSGESPSTDKNIYITTNIDTWDSSGSVESHIFDTSLSTPIYNQVKWSEDSPTGTEITLKARSDSDEYMAGATDWESVTGSTSNPGGLSIGTGRYVQFLAELASDPYWEVSSTEKTYEEYVDDQVDNYAVTDFPAVSGTPYVTGVYSVWIDDVEIDWPGRERICNVTGYIARKNNYGQAKIIVDGEELVKILSVHVATEDEVQGRTISAENYIEVQPRNTGK